MGKTADMERRAVVKALAIGIPVSIVSAGGAALIGAGSPGPGDFVKRTGDTMTGDLEITPSNKGFIASAQILPGGYSFRKTASVRRRAMGYSISPDQVFFGDNAIPLNVTATFVGNALVPWRDLVLDTESVVTSLTEGNLRRHTVGRIPQFVSKDNNNVKLWKSSCLLWETSQFTVAVGTNQYPIVFANPMNDANYFVVLEFDDFGALTQQPMGITNKLNTGFTIDVNTAAMLGVEVISWFAVRYGI